MSAAVLVAYSGFAGSMWWVQADARAFGRRAMQEYTGDEVEALVAFVRSDTHDLADRNRAVHALGQFGDPRAVRVLDAYYTGRRCDHARFLCQRELRKAIDRCNGRNRPPSWLPFLPPR